MYRFIRELSCLSLLPIAILLRKWGATVLLCVLAVVQGAYAGTVTYVYTDHLGSVLAEADSGGNILARYEYSPYGQALVSPGMGTPKDGPGYTGHVGDIDTSLIYMQARYYDPVAGRFLSVDPMGVASAESFSVNRYRYAANNPIGYSDPDGRQECRSCEMSYGAAVGYTLRNQPDRLRVWADGERAATNAQGSLEGAELGAAAGRFVDTGDYSKPAVAGVLAQAVILAVTHGKANWKSVTQFGHTFSTHGEGRKVTARLTDRARGTGKPQGQWTDNEKAAQFLSGVKVEGATVIKIPEGIGQVIMPDGTIVKTEWARVVPRGDGVRSAFPVVPQEPK